MTKTWGPLGWATLHSIAALYPDNPSDLEKALISRWIESFRGCIVCEKCKTHFTTLLNEYIIVHPDWNASRKNLSLFVVRAHNTVNVRQTGRPVLSAQEAIDHMKRNIPSDKAHLIRQSYIVHIRAEWSKLMGLDAVTAAKFIRDLVMTETDYWGTRIVDWNLVENLIKYESVEPLPSRRKETSIFAFRVPQPKISQPTSVQPKNPTIMSVGPKPRFSFLSR